MTEVTVVDVRVARRDQDLAVVTLRSLVVRSAMMEAVATLAVDEHPPAAGPEVQITVTGAPEAVVRDELEHVGVAVLAIRSHEQETDSPSARYLEQEQRVFALVTAILTEDTRAADVDVPSEELVSLLSVAANVIANIVRLDAFTTYGTANGQDAMRQVMSSMDREQWLTFTLEHWRRLLVQLQNTRIEE
jgi:hypothetical protein